MLIIRNEKNTTKSFDLKQKDSIFFIDCENCCFIIPNKINKISISNCHDMKFNINNAISSMEIVKSSKLNILIYGNLMTTQLDSVNNSEIHYYYSNGFVISSGTDSVLITTPNKNLVLPYHMFLQQYITNLETWATKRREECIDQEGYLLLD